MIVPVTDLSPISVLLTAILVGVALLAPKRFVATPIVVAVAFLPADQRVILADMDWSMIRLVILSSLIRIAIRSEWQGVAVHTLDKVVVSLAVFMLLGAASIGTSSEVISRLGVIFDLFGTYFIVRFISDSRSAVEATLIMVLVSMAILAAFMAVEWQTGKNWFSKIGAVPEITVIRDGRLRCQGAFSHPILAGMYGAAWGPLSYYFWKTDRRVTGALTLFFCTLVVFFSSSSTPVLSLALGMSALALWQVRQYIYIFRWSFFLMLVLLHFVREKPVWHLLSRINVIGGSTGHHRYIVIDKAIQHFDEWWLIGTSAIGHWGVHWNDITNNYVAAGINAGLPGLIAFVMIFVIAFQNLGKLWQSDRVTEISLLGWCMGCVMLVHAAAFFSVSYFAQMVFVYYLQLGLIGSAVTFGPVILAELQEGSTEHRRGLVFLD